MTVIICILAALAIIAAFAYVCSGPTTPVIVHEHHTHTYNVTVVARDMATDPPVRDYLDVPMMSTQAALSAYRPSAPPRRPLLTA